MRHEEQSISKSLPSAEKVRQRESDSVSVGKSPVLQNLMNHGQPSHQGYLSISTTSTAIPKRPESVPLNLADLSETPKLRLNYSPAVAKSPFLPQISPSMPVGSKSITAKSPPFTLQRFGCYFPREAVNDSSNCFGSASKLDICSSGESDNCGRNKSFSKQQILLIPDANYYVKKNSLNQRNNLSTVEEVSSWGRGGVCQSDPKVQYMKVSTLCYCSRTLKARTPWDHEN